MKQAKSISKGIILKSIDDILGINQKNFSDDFQKLGFGVIEDIVRTCGFTPVIIDIAIRSNNKWAVVAFKENAQKTKATLFIKNYIACLKQVIIKENRHVLEHEDFQKKRKVIICNATNQKRYPPIIPVRLKKQHLSNIKDNQVWLYKYLDDLLIGNSEEKKRGENTTKETPEKNAHRIYSLFSYLMKENFSNLAFICIPITRITKHKQKMHTHEREFIGGAFLFIKKNKDSSLKDISKDIQFNYMCISIMTVFYKGLIDWKEERNVIAMIDFEKWKILKGEYPTDLKNPHHFKFGGCLE